MKNSLSPREIPRAKAGGFPGILCYIVSYIPTRVTILTFSITNPAFYFLETNNRRVDFPYCSDSWAIWENIAQYIEQY